MRYTKTQLHYRFVRLRGAFAIAGLLALVACSEQPPPALTGATMGTVYTVRLAALPPGVRQAELATAIERELAAVNAAMSTYADDSEISGFNRYPGTDWFPVSRELALVVSRATQLAELTDGAFDVTVAPLVDAWGFGPAGRRDSPPAAETLQSAAGEVGRSRLQLRLDPPALRKTAPGTRIDLSAIAKGHGVDRIAALLEAAGVPGYLVDIGGDLRVHGRRYDGRPWRIGIERPDSTGGQVQRVLDMRADAAVATSGDYRNFFETGGRRYPHIIDPRTGEPIANGIASVSVVAEDCTSADGWATALSVMGADDGYRLATEQQLPVSFIIRDGDQFRERMTPAFERWLFRASEAPAGNQDYD